MPIIKCKQRNIVEKDMLQASSCITNQMRVEICFQIRLDHTNAINITCTDRPTGHSFIIYQPASNRLKNICRWRFRNWSKYKTLRGVTTLLRRSDSSFRLNTQNESLQFSTCRENIANQYKNESHFQTILYLYSIQ